MKLANLSIFLALPLAAQVVVETPVITGVASIAPKAFTAKLYGHNVPVLVANVWLKNIGTEPYTFGSADLYISLPSINAIPFSDAQLALTGAYNGNIISKLGTIAGTTGTVIAAVAVASHPVFSAAALANIMLALNGAQSGINFLQSQRTPLSTLLANDCDDKFSGNSLALIAGGSTTCKLYLAIPPKGTLLPSSIGFQLVANVPVPNTPLPPPAPVKSARPPIRQTAVLPGNILAVPTAVSHDAKLRPDLDPEYIRAHPDEADPYYVDAHPPGYWRNAESEVLIAKGIR